MAGAERVFRLLDSKPDWEEPPTARELPRIHGRVEFRNVIFRYAPDRDRSACHVLGCGAGRNDADPGQFGCSANTVQTLETSWNRGH